MAVTAELVRSWRAPRDAIRRQIGTITEARLLAYLIGACVLIFVGQWPLAARLAHLDPAVPLDQRIGGALFAWVFVMPLVLYGLAALSHLAAGFIGGRGTWQGARLALFWSLLASTPLFLLYGLVAGLIGPGLQLNLAGGALAVGFLGHWLLALAEAEGFGTP